MRRLAILLLALITLTACNDGGEELIDKYADRPSATAQMYAGIGSAFELEREFIAESDDSAEGIVSFFGTGYRKAGDRLFFTARKYYENSDNTEQSLVYASLKTGECFSVCPDPLCTHLEDSGCRYLNLDSFVLPSDGTGNLVWAVKSDFGSGGMVRSLCEIDLDADTITSIWSDESVNFILPRFESGGRLYFETTTMLEELSQDGVVTERVIEELRCINLETREVTNFGELSGSGGCYFSDGESLYFVDYDLGELCATDMSFANRRTVFAWKEGYQPSNIFLDEATGQLFICVYLRDMTISPESVETPSGAIYVVEPDGSSRKLPLDCDRVLELVLTEKYVYYTKFDPVEYGNSPRGTPAILEDGAKIYRALRSAPTESELIFDGGDLLFSSWAVVGGHIYIDWMRLMDANGMQWFRHAGITARIDPERRTLAWLTLE